MPEDPQEELTEPETDSESADSESPEEEQSPSDDPLEGDEELQEAFYALYLECCGEDRYPRLMEVKDVSQAERYWGGRQYNWWSEEDKKWNLPTQGTPTAYGDLDVEDEPRFQFVTNIYQSRGLMTIGAGAGAPPRYRFFPNDADNPDDIDTAAGRTKEAKLIQRWNPIQKMLQQEYYHAYTGGFIAWWSRYVANGEKYGVDSVNMLSQSEQEVGSTISCPDCGWSAPADEAEPPIPCPQCQSPLTEENITEEEPIPVPEDGGQTDVPKGRQVISIYGALNSKRPQCTDEQSEWHYFAIEMEMHYAKLKAAFPDKADEIKAGLTFGADDVFERNARLAISANTKSQTQTGSNQASLCTFARVWFRPSAFWMLKDKDQRDRALEKFPRGIRCEFAGKVYCQAEDESMDDAIVSCHAMPGRGQHRPGIGTSMLSVQDRFNTLTNISMETYEYGIPITYRASDTFSSEADSEQRAAPGLEIEVMVPPNVDLKTRIMQTRADSVSPDMQKHMMDLMGPVPDELTGTYPALTGAGKDQPETLGQQAMQRDAAMGRQGIFYVNIKQAHADVMTISCRCLEKHEEGVLKIPVFGNSGDFESETVDVTALEGEAEAYPEGDENFPELWNQKRATFMQVADTRYGQELMKDPGNQQVGLKLIGIEDLKSPQTDAWQKQLKEINELTKIPEGDDLLTGIAPSVEVDPKHDDNVTESACCKWWVNNELGQKCKRQNPVGYQAVIEHWDQHTEAIPKAPPPQKPLSETFTANFKDLPPEAQIQALEQMGIHIDAQAFVQQAMVEQAKKGPPKPSPFPTGAPAAPPSK
jgi:hypothetical protein